MKILFLDIDGVLNNEEDFVQQYKMRGTNVIGQPRLNLLRTILEKTQCKIVLSSTWRLYDWRSDLEVHGFPTNEIIGCTPNLFQIDSRIRRGTEIHEYLAENFPRCEDPSDPKYLESFCIVDDGSDFLSYQLPFFVQTNFEEGLTPADTERIIDILKDTQRTAG